MMKELIEKYLTEQKNIDDLVEEMDRARGTFIIVLGRMTKHFKSKTSQKPLMDYIKADRKLWDKLIDDYNKMD